MWYFTLHYNIFQKLQATVTVTGAPEVPADVHLGHAQLRLALVKAVRRGDHHACACMGQHGGVKRRADRHARAMGHGATGPRGHGAMCHGSRMCMGQGGGLVRLSVPVRRVRVHAWVCMGGVCARWGEGGVLRRADRDACACMG